LFYVDSDGTRLVNDVFSVGSGSPYAYGVLDRGALCASNAPWCVPTIESLTPVRLSLGPHPRGGVRPGPSCNLSCHLPRRCVWWPRQLYALLCYCRLILMHVLLHGSVPHEGDWLGEDFQRRCVPAALQVRGREGSVGLSSSLATMSCLCLVGCILAYAKMGSKQGKATNKGPHGSRLPLPKMFCGSTVCLTARSMLTPVSPSVSLTHCLRTLPTAAQKCSRLLNQQKQDTA
jgi:hypothetical protein